MGAGQGEYGVPAFPIALKLPTYPHDHRLVNVKYSPQHSSASENKPCARQHPHSGGEGMPASQLFTGLRRLRRRGGCPRHMLHRCVLASAKRGLSGAPLLSVPASLQQRGRRLGRLRRALVAKVGSPATKPLAGEKCCVRRCSRISVGYLPPKGENQKF